MAKDDINPATGRSRSEDKRMAALAKREAAKADAAIRVAAEASRRRRASQN